MRSIIPILLLLLSVSLSGQSLSQRDLEYYESQNSLFTKEIEAIFDTLTPGYHSTERVRALHMVDAITHYPFPHDDQLKGMFLNRYRKSVQDISKAEVRGGAVAWNIYNMSYVVKTPEIIVAFDIIRLPDSLRKENEEDIHKQLVKELVEQCDLLFVSHIHQDHADPYVAGEFLRQGKQVIAPSGVFKNEDFYDRICHLERSGKKVRMEVPSTGTGISVRIYPGHQAIAADAAVDNNFTVLTLPNHITVAHSGDQAWGDDFSWLDHIYKEVNIDLLMVNTWTADPVRLIRGLQPKTVLPGHINEMSHGISGRISYWRSYLTWKPAACEVVHLFWGESYHYEKKND
ncbi:MAG: hypothetical protein ABFS10_04945 [Bacteroidota bacterium]